MKCNHLHDSKVKKCHSVDLANTMSYYRILGIDTTALTLIRNWNWATTKANVVALLFHVPSILQILFCLNSFSTWKCGIKGLTWKQPVNVALLNFIYKVLLTIDIEIMVSIYERSLTSKPETTVAKKNTSWDRRKKTWEEPGNPCMKGTHPFFGWHGIVLVIITAARKQNNRKKNKSKQIHVCMSQWRDSVAYLPLVIRYVSGQPRWQFPAIVQKNSLDLGGNCGFGILNTVKQKICSHTDTILIYCAVHYFSVNFN